MNLIDPIADALDPYLSNKSDGVEAAYSVLAALFNSEAHIGYETSEIIRRTVLLPELAPELFTERKDRTETPIEFYQRVWRPYRQYLYQDDLRRMDERLVKAIGAYCSHHGMSSPEYLPPTQAVRIDRAFAKAPSDSYSADFLRGRINKRKEMRDRQAKRPKSAPF